MANSTIGIELDASTALKELDELKSEYNQVLTEIATWDKKSAQYTRDLTKVTNELAAARDKVTKAGRGTVSYKTARDEVKRLQTAYRELTAQRREAANVTKILQKRQTEITKNMKSQVQVTKQVVAANNKVAKSERNASRWLVNHIRMMESYLVAMYGAIKIYKVTIGAGLEYNAMIEKETIGLRLLINQTTQYTNAQGKVVKGMEAYALASKEAGKAMKIVRDINVETPHTLAQTLSIYKLLVPQVKQFGGNLEQVGEITKGVSLLGAQMGVEYQEILKVIDSMFSGQMHESGLKRALSVVGITPEEVRKVKESGGDLVQFMIDRLKLVSLAAEDTRNSWQGIVAQYQTLIDNLRGEAFKPFFEGAKHLLSDLNDAIRNNTDSVVEAAYAFNAFVRTVSGADVIKASVSLLGLFALKFKIVRTSIVSATEALAGFLAVSRGAVIGVAGLGAVFYELLDYQRKLIEIKRERERMDAERKYEESREISYLPAENLKREKELIARQKELGKLLRETDDIAEKNAIRAEQRSIAQERRDLRVFTNLKKAREVGKIDEKGEYKAEPVPVGDFRKTLEWAKQLRSTLKGAKDEYWELTHGGDAVVGIVKKIGEYNALLKERARLDSLVGKRGVDQEKLKQAMLKVNLGIQQKENEIVSAGNTLRDKGIQTLEKEAKLRERNSQAAFDLVENLKRQYVKGYAFDQDTVNNYTLVNTLYEQGLIPNVETYRQIIEGLNEDTIEHYEGLDKANDEWKKDITEIKDMIGDKLENAMMQTFSSWRKGAMDFGEMMTNLLGDIADELMRIMVVQPLVNSFSKSFGFAEGAAFANGRVTAFANGGVVTQPTVFPMASGLGLMGEAGAEAVMPLTRTRNGDLGVKATGGDVIINVENETGLPVSMEKLSDSMQDDGSRIIEVVMRHAETNPEFRRVMEIGS